MNRDMLGAYLAEAIATFTLVFAGCGAIIADSMKHGSVGYLAGRSCWTRCLGER